MIIKPSPEVKPEPEPSSGPKPMPMPKPEAKLELDKQLELYLEHALRPKLILELVSCFKPELSPELKWKELPKASSSN